MPLIASVGDIAGVVGAAIALVAIGVSVYLWLRGRQVKRLSYRLSSPPVVNIRSEAEDAITVLYEGQPVGDVRLLDLRVENTGNTEIREGDFQRPLSVALGEGATVLRFEVGGTAPSDLDPDVSIVEADLTIAPLLLNPGDWLEITALVSDLSEGDRLQGRVAGVARFSEPGVGSPRRWWEVGRHSAALSSAFVAVAAGTFVAGAVGLLVQGDKKTHSVVELKGGQPGICGDVIRTDSATIVVKQKDGGVLRTVPLADARAIRDNAC